MNPPIPEHAGGAHRTIDLPRIVQIIWRSHSATVKTALSPKDLAQAIGVSESSLKRWADDGRIRVARTAGGHRRIAVPEAVRFLRDSGLTLVHPEVLGLPELADVHGELAQAGDDLAASHDLLFNALNAGDERRSRGIMLDLYLAGHSLAAIFDGPIRHAMHRLGELWLHSTSGIYIEHRATDICIHTLALLRTMAVREGEPLPADGRLAQAVALGGAPEGDPYTLPSLMAAIVLAEAGYRDVNLGAETPMPALIAAMAHYQPRLVWLSCSVPEAVPDEAALRSLADEVGRLGARLVVGGRAIEPMRSLGRLPHVQPVHSMTELAAFARGLRAAV